MTECTLFRIKTVVCSFKRWTFLPNFIKIMFEAQRMKYFTESQRSDVVGQNFLPSSPLPWIMWWPLRLICWPRGGAWPVCSEPVDYLYMMCLHMSGSNRNMPLWLSCSRTNDRYCNCCCGMSAELQQRCESDLVLLHVFECKCVRHDEEMKSVWFSDCSWTTSALLLTVPQYFCQTVERCWKSGFSGQRAHSLTLESVMNTCCDFLTNQNLPTKFLFKCLSKCDLCN